MGFRFSTDLPSDELIASKHIAGELGKLPFFKDEKAFDCYFNVEPRLGNHKVKSADILLICNFKKPQIINFKRPLKYINNKESREVASVQLNNFISPIEVKMHSYEKIRFNESNKLEVWYAKQKYWKDVTNQTRESLFAAKDILTKRGNTNLFLPSITYLHNIQKEQFDNHSGENFPIEIICNNNITSKLLLSVCHQLLQMKMPKSIRVKESEIYSCLNKKIRFYLDSNWVESGPKPSKFDMKRMTAIAAKVEPWHIDDVTKRMVEYKGVGGTGKTIKLLQIAYQKYEEENKSILFLTYNWSLIVGLRLTMEHMGIPYHHGEHPGIKPESCTKFFWSILTNLGYIKKEDTDLIDNNSKEFERIYQRSITSCIKDLKDIKDEEDLKSFLKANSGLDESVFSDLVIVDEGQDWMPEEQFILDKIFGYKNILVAHGDGQETRGTPTIWGKQLLTTHLREPDCQKRFHTLRKAMRMRGNLGNFVKTFADLTLTNKIYEKLEANTDVLGGDIYIIEGDYFQQKQLREELKQKRENEIGDVYPIDLLHIVPPKMKVSDFNHGLNEEYIWDGVDEIKRKNLPSSEKCIRWVNYRSCRGLEGWITFNHYLDEYWEYEFNTQKIETQGSLFENATEPQKRNEAFRWVLIALTRPIDSTIITLKNKDSELGKILRTIHETHSEFVHWIS